MWIGLWALGGQGWVSRSCAGAGAEGWEGRGRWAGPETPAVGLALALAWRAATREPCVGMSQGCPPAAPETETVGKISVLWSEPGGGWQGPPWAQKPAQRTELLHCHPAVVCLSSQSTSRAHCQARPCPRVRLARQACRKPASGLMREPSASDGCPSHERVVGTSSPSLVLAASPAPCPCFCRGARMSWAVSVP